jgi:hypothetical protein
MIDLLRSSLSALLLSPLACRTLHSAFLYFPLTRWLASPSCLLNSLFSSSVASLSLSIASTAVPPTLGRLRSLLSSPMLCSVHEHAGGEDASALVTDILSYTRRDTIHSTTCT